MTGFGKIGQKGHFWAKFFDHFWPKTAKTRFFRQNPKMSLPSHSEATTLCKKSENSYERILRSRSNERTDGHTDGRTYGSETIGPQRRWRGTKYIIKISILTKFRGLTFIGPRHRRWGPMVSLPYVRMSVRPI